MTPEVMKILYLKSNVGQWSNQLNIQKMNPIFDAEARHLKNMLFVFLLRRSNVEAPPNGTSILDNSDVFKMAFEVFLHKQLTGKDTKKFC